MPPIRIKTFVSALAVAALAAGPVLSQAQQPKLQRPVAPVVVPQVQTPLNLGDPDVPVVKIAGRAPVRIIPSPADLWAGIPQFASPDNDHDGHRTITVGGDDCDDADPNRFPGNPEVADYAGHDEDCNYETIGHRDADGDGFVSWTATNILKTAGGRVYGVYVGEDCDDEKSDTHPGAAEIVGDERDNDCNGVVDDLRRGHGLYCQPTATVKLSAILRERPSGWAPPVCANY